MYLTLLKRTLKNSIDGKFNIICILSQVNIVEILKNKYVKGLNGMRRGKSIIAKKKKREREMNA